MRKYWNNLFSSTRWGLRRGGRKPRTPPFLKSPGMCRWPCRPLHCTGRTLLSASAREPQTAEPNTGGCLVYPSPSLWFWPSQTPTVHASCLQLPPKTALHLSKAVKSLCVRNAGIKLRPATAVVSIYSTLYSYLFLRGNQTCTAI